MQPFAIQPPSAFEPNKVGAWTGVPMEAYQFAPGESHSLLTLLARSPLRYKMTRERLLSREEPTHDMALGTMIHAAVNEGHEPAYHLRPLTYRGAESSKKDAPIIDKPWNANSNACKEWLASHKDKPILEPWEALMLNSLTACVRENKRAMRLIEGAQTEVSACAFNKNMELPYLLRARFDVLGKDDKGWYWVETKSTRNAATDSFSWEIKKRNYMVQCALYRRVIERLTGEDVRCFMVILEKDAAIPRCNVRQLAKAAMDFGDKTLDDRLQLLKRCKLADKWPALVDEEDGDHIPFIDLPESCYGDTDLLKGLTEIEDE